MRQIGFLKFGREALEHFTLGGRFFDEDEFGRGAWHVNFYRALYRVCLVGAVLAGGFDEPLFAAIEGGDGDGGEVGDEESDS